MPLSRPVRDELFALGRLAAPVVTVQLGLMLMGTVDSIFVGHYSPDALAAVILGNIYHWSLLVFGMGILLALDPLVSQAFGAGDRGSIRLSFYRGLVVAAAISGLFAIAFRYAEPVLRLCGQPADVLPLAGAFVRALTPGIPPFFAFVVVRQTLQGMNIVRPVVIAVIIGNLANVAGNWIFVYGHLGMPALGAVGSGWSTTCARYVMLLVLLWVAVPAFRDGFARGAGRIFDGRAILRFLAVGFPIGVQIALEVWAFMAASLAMGRMGKLVLDGHQIAINLASLSFMVPYGVGAAASVRVGNAIGRSDSAGTRRAAVVALFTGASVMVVSASAFALVPRLLARVYTSDEAIIESAAGLLPIAAVFQIFDGTQAVGCGILRGSADTRIAAAINLVGYWLLGLPIGILLAFPLHFGPRGLWWGLTAGLAIVAALLVVRVRRRFVRVA